MTTENKKDAVEALDVRTGSRFRLEERSGIVAIYDTAHPEYRDTPGCHGDYPWTICHWNGVYTADAGGFGKWSVDERLLEKAKQTCALLNDLHANKQI